MLPGDVVWERGLHHSNIDIDASKPIEIGNKIWRNNPRQQQALAWVMRDGQTRVTPRKVFGHLEDSPDANWVQYIGADESAQATTGLVIANGDGRISEGSRVWFPDIDEIIRFDADFASSTTSAGVSRNQGAGSSATSLLKKDMLGILLTPGQYEGFVTGEGNSNPKVQRTFRTGISNWVVEVSDTEEAEAHHGYGSQFLYDLDKKWMLMKEQMEADLFFGAEVVTTKNNRPYQSPTGLIRFIQTNVFDFSLLTHAPTRQDIWDVIAEWTMFNKNGGVIFCSKPFIHWITNLAFMKVIYDETVKADGLEIRQIKTPDGMFDLIEVDCLNAHPTLMGMAFFVPRGKIDYRPLQGLDITYRPIREDKKHSIWGEIYGQFGWHYHEEETFALVKGMRF